MHPPCSCGSRKKNYPALRMKNRTFPLFPALGTAPQEAKRSSDSLPWDQPLPWPFLPGVDLTGSMDENYALALPSPFAKLAAESRSARSSKFRLPCPDPLTAAHKSIQPRERVAGTALPCTGEIPNRSIELAVLCFGPQNPIENPYPTCFNWKSTSWRALTSGYFLHGFILLLTGTKTAWQERV